MTTRTDVVQDFTNSPRITTVLAPSTEFELQDIVDTLRKFEDTFRGMSETRLLDAAGKTPLSPAESTPITGTGKNNLIEFEARRTPAETGTITTQGLADARGLIQLTDTAADFVAANIQPGSFVINFTDFSVTDVRRRIDSQNLECKALVNGTDNQFDVNDVYHIFNIVQCEVLGGNKVAVDDVDSSISPILPSAFTQVVTVRASGSTLINGDAASFWDALTADHEVSGSFGEYVRKKLLSTVKFLGLK